MKNLFYIAIMLILGGQLISCKQEKSATAEPEKPIVQFEASEAGSSMQWTAYKTTDRVPWQITQKNLVFYSKHLSPVAQVGFCQDSLTCIRVIKLVSFGIMILVNAVITHHGKGVEMMQGIAISESIFGIHRKLQDIFRT